MSMSVNQRRVCQIEELPLNFPPQAGRQCNPRRVLVMERTNDVSSSPKTSRLVRRETASRLLDLAQNPPPQTATLPKTNRLPPPRLTKTSSWKSSKFFSRTMTSAEMLKNLKKLSVSTSPTTTTTTTLPTTTTAPSAKRSTSDSWKIAKNRLCSAKRKAAAGSTVTISVHEGTSKRLGSEPVSDLLIDPPTTILRKKSEDEGIVCKKEDLMSLMKKAPKQGSPKPRRASLKSASSSSLEPNKSTDDDAEDNKEPVRRSSFETVRNKLKNTFIGSSNSEVKGSEVSLDVEAKVIIITDKVECEEPSAPLLVSPSADRPSSVKVEKVIEEEEKVEWDDGNFVNPMLLGGAIEAFLKGMGGGTTTEKRVSFKKN